MKSLTGMSSGHCPPQFCRQAEHLLLYLLPIKFLMVSWERLSNSCDMWNSKLFRFSVHFSCVIKTSNWLLTAIKTIHWSDNISKFGTFSFTEFHLVLFSNFVSFFFGFVYLTFWTNFNNTIGLILFYHGSSTSLTLIRNRLTWVS